MSQIFIDSLMHFFSLLLLPVPGKKVERVKELLKDYITKAGILFPVDECLKIYTSYSGKYFFELSSLAYKPQEDIERIQAHLILEAGQKAQENLLLQERILVILSLFEFNRIKLDNSEKFSAHIRELSKSLNLKNDDLIECEYFIYGQPPEKKENELIFEDSDQSEELEGEWVKENIPYFKGEKIKRIREKIKTNIRFRFFESYNFIAFIYNGNHPLFINEIKAYPGYFYSFRRKDVLQFEGLPAISFEEIEENFGKKIHKVVLSGKDLYFRYKSTKNSIKRFSFSEESGQIIGVIGNNGVGKSTLLKLISNQLDPMDGELCINGTNVVKNKYRLKPLIGYVSHDQIEFPELSIYENLMYQAQLCLGNMNSGDIQKRVNDTLDRWSLQELRNKKAGKYANSKINDFQRICLRIAIEMIRNPYILLLDEPLSGLSFSDSKRLISILKEEIQKGKLVIMSSQLPASDIYNLFDKVWLIDSGGYMIFCGPPMASLSFFRNTGLLPYYYIQSRSDVVSAEDVIKVVETKKIRSDGSISEERQIDPGTWYDAWRAESDKRSSSTTPEVKPLPVYGTGLPGIEKQFFVYLLRNFKNRFLSTRFIVSNLLGVPAAGVLIALITGYGREDQYILSENPFLPLFLFLSVNLILLTSMLLGSEEVFREKLQLRRDLSLNLSPFSYFNAKVAYIFCISLLQIFIYTILTNIVLGIKGMTMNYLFIYFSVAAFGNLFSLSLSYSFRKLNSIYILIPFFIIPNLIFTGYLIPFNHAGMGKNFNESVPMIANIFPSRWAYELMMVEQYTENSYNKYVFPEEKNLYRTKYLQKNLIPALITQLDECQRFKYITPNEDSLKKHLDIIQTEFLLLSASENIAPFENIQNLVPAEFDSSLYDETFGYLTYLRFLSENLIVEAEAGIARVEEHLRDSLQGKSSVFRARNMNYAVEKLVKEVSLNEKVLIKGDKLIKIGSPVYLRPESPFGRSHFYASEKRFNNQYLSLNRFNMTAIWLLNLFLYVLLLSDGMNVFLNLFRKQNQH